MSNYSSVKHLERPTKTRSLFVASLWAIAGMISFPAATFIAHECVADSSRDAGSSASDDSGMGNSYNYQPNKSGLNVPGVPSARPNDADNSFNSVNGRIATHQQQAGQAAVGETATCADTNDSQLCPQPGHNP